VRRRILLTIVAMAALSVAAFFVPAALAVRSRIQRRDLLELQREAAIVASRIPPSGPIDLSSIEDVIDPGHDLAVYDRDGLVEGRGPSTADAVVRDSASGVFAEGLVDGDLVAAVPLRPGPAGPELVVRIREPRQASERRVVESVVLLGVAALAIVAVAAFVGALLARRLSRPIEELGEWATSLGRRAHQPPPPPSGIAEIDELSASLTTAHERIQELLQRERSFSSHVAHQLRTPVTAMRVTVEAELDAPRPDATAVLHESLSALERLEFTITSLLTLARHDDRQPMLCDVTGLVRAEVDRWTPTYVGAGRDLSMTGSTAIARVDPAALRHIVEVLLDNALRHGEGRVDVKVRASGDHIDVDVADRGLADRQLDPFSEGRSADGHGIGLRLARTLAESEGGGLQLLDLATTTFRLTLTALG
jgi:signal transduction histidine kinase